MNKNLKTGLIVGGLGALIYAGYRYYKKQIALISDYDYKIIGATINTISKNEVSLNLKFRFSSLSNIEAQVNKIYLDVKVQGVSVGYISDVKPFLIPAKGSSDIDIQIVFNPQLILKNVVTVLLSGLSQKDLNFTLSGYANIKSGFISTTLPISYSDKVSAYL